jgi:hypothetical protein
MLQCIDLIFSLAQSCSQTVDGFLLFYRPLPASGGEIIFGGLQLGINGTESSKVSVQKGNDGNPDKDDAAPLW